MSKTIIYKLNCRFLCFIIILLTMMGVVSAKSQGDERITLNLKNVPLEQVMDKIKHQSQYLFVNQGVDTKVLVTLNVKNQRVKDVCKQLFHPIHVDFIIVGTSIIIRKQIEKKPVIVQGRVYDEQGNYLPGVSVFIKGTQIGTVTNIEGDFTFEIPAEHVSGTIEFNSLGYEVQLYPINGKTLFNVQLKEKKVSLDGTVVTALGIRRDEKALSYNVQEVKSDLITGVKNTNFINSLAGKVAGVTINSSSSGIGGAAKVVLRGNKSISQSSNALYVIDGIPMYNFGGGGGTEFDSKGETESIADINPEDIESISVLTGAAAAALYGSEAANGAILITTKKGIAGDVKASFSSSTELFTPFILPKFQNRYGTGLNGKNSGSAVYSWGAKIPEGTGYKYTPMDYFNTGVTYTNSFALSGGTDKNQTYLSAAAINSDGIIPNNKYDRYNFTFRNTTYLLDEKLRLDMSVSYIKQMNQNMTNQGVYSNPLVPVYLFPRGENFDLYRSFERYNPASKMMEQFWGLDLVGDKRMQNPYWINYRNLRNDNRDRYMATFTAGYKFTPWLNLTGRVKIDNTNNLFTDKKYASTEITIAEGKNGYYGEERGLDKQTYTDILLNFDKNFGEDWNVVANVGGSYNSIQTNSFKYSGPIRENGLANIFNVMDLDDTKKKAEKYGWHDETLALFGSFEFGWKRMLYLTVTGRNDWASQLAGSSSKSFFYPSVGLSWVPTAEWDLGIINYLKLRGSIASVGMPFPRFLTMPTYEYDYTSKIWKDKTHYPITDLKPEKTTTYEVGVEATLLKDFNLNLSWYLADTYNQTFDPHLPPSSSYTTIYLQTGSVRNLGVEVSLGYEHMWENFNWNSNFTFSWNKNKIRDLADNAVNPITNEPLNITELQIKGLGKVHYLLRKGGTLGDLYTTSNLKYSDKGYIELDKNGDVSMTDEGEELYLGTVFPKYNLAWRNEFKWKGINFGFLFSGRIGGVNFSATQANLDLYGVSEDSAIARDAGGVLLNGRTMLDAQKWYQKIGSQDGLPQLYLYSSTNFRLQELSLGYTLPKNWFKGKMGVTLSLVGHNLWMIWNKAPFDPEVVASTGNNYQGIDFFMMPSLRKVGANVKLEF